MKLTDAAHDHRKVPRLVRAEFHRGRSDLSAIEIAKD